MGLLREFQADRGLSLNLLQSCRVREIVVGETSKEEILEIQEWAKEQLGRDQVFLPCSAVSLDVEDQQTSLYDVYRMSGKIVLPEKKRPISNTLEPQV